MISIRPAHGSDVPNVIELWRSTRPHDYVDPTKLERFLNSSSFFLPEATLVAVDDGELAGFIVGTVRGKEEGRIPLLMVSRRHVNSPVGDGLLRRVLDFFMAAGLRRVEAGTSWETRLSDCGYDSRYTETIQIFLRNGFQKVWSDDELDADILKDLRTFEIPQSVSDARSALEQRGLDFGVCTPEMPGSYLDFMLRHFADYKRWCARAEAYVEHDSETGFHMLAMRDEEIVGFTECVLDSDWHVYATGVRSDMRRRKIGTVLVYLSFLEMKRRGAQEALVGEAPLDFYRVVHGQVLRRYMVMCRNL